MADRTGIRGHLFHCRRYVSIDIPGFAILDTNLAAVGQEEDFEAAKAKAVQVGARKCIVQDLKKEFVESQCWPAIMCNAHYENVGH